MKRPKRYQLNTPNRYQLAPQMRDYDAIRVNWVSYLMFMQTSGFGSVSVNIDESGLRYSDQIEETLDRCFFEFGILEIGGI